MGSVTNTVIKRGYDSAFSVIGLALLSPIFLLIMLLVKKPIITQERVGLKGKRFRMYKFRTMRLDALLYEHAPREPRDQRVTRFGRWLRKSSLDELPQLWNVLKGDMSLVGPRPEMPFLVEKYTIEEKRRLDVLPGITGLWQVSGRKDIPLQENLGLDLFYVDHWGLWLDIKILFKTIIVVLSCKGAY